MESRIWKGMQIAAWMVLIVVYYFTDTRGSDRRAADISERVAIVEARSLETERKTNNELIGYQELIKGVGMQLGEMNERLSRMEGRMETRKKL